MTLSIVWHTTRSHLTTNNHNLYCMTHYLITLQPQTITICIVWHTTRSHSTTNNHNLQWSTHYSITLDHKQSQSALYDTLLDHTRPQTITIYTEGHTTREHSNHKQSQSALKYTLLDHTRPQTITICTVGHTTRSHSTTNNHNLHWRTHYSITLGHKQSQSTQWSLIETVNICSLFVVI